jgi:hypothetical protein
MELHRRNCVKSNCKTAVYEYYAVQNSVYWILFNYSNSTVPGGLLVKSYKHRLTPRTSFTILLVTRFIHP